MASVGSVLLAICFTWAQPAPATPTHRTTPTLRGVTTIELSGSGALTVELRHSAIFDLGNFRDHFREALSPSTPQGRFNGIILAPEPKRDSLTLAIGVLRECSSKGCAKGRTVPFTYPPEKDQVRLARGRYRLYGITDGAPARIKLGLDGISGRTHLGTTEDVFSQVRSPSNHYDDVAGRTLFSAGGTYAVKGHRGGLALGLLWLDSERYEYSGFGYCIQPKSSIEPPPEVMYAPGCQVTSGATGGNGGTFVPPQAKITPHSRHVSFDYTITDLAPGKWNFGMWIGGGSTIDQAGLTTVFMSL